MAQNPGEHEVSNNDPLAQNNLLRRTINAMPKRRRLAAGATQEDKKAQLDAAINRLTKRDDQEYRVMLRNQFAARLAESYATPSLQRYALILFEDVYNSGLQNDAMVPYDKQQRPHNIAESTLLLLAATHDLTSPGLYDLQTAKDTETLLYSCALNRIYLTAGLIQGEVSSMFALNHYLVEEIQQLQEITTEWQQEYQVQYGEDIRAKLT